MLLSRSGAFADKIGEQESFRLPEQGMRLVSRPNSWLGSGSSIG